MTGDVASDEALVFGPKAARKTWGKGVLYECMAVTTAKSDVISVLSSTLRSRQVHSRRCQAEEGRRLLLHQSLLHQVQVAKPVAR